MKLNVKKYKVKTPPTAHSWAFCRSISSFNNDNFCFIFQGGIGYDNESLMPVDTKKLFQYNPILKKFNCICDSFPKCVFRSSIIHRKKKGINCFVVFAGNLVKEFEPCKILWEFNLKNKKWKKLKFPNPPYEVAFHTSLYNEKRDQMFVFGGRKNNERKKFILICDFKKKSWIVNRNSSFPLKGLAGHSMDWYNRHKEKFIVFGGADSNLDGCSNRTFEYDIITKKMIEYKCKGKKPDPRSSHSSCVYKNFFYVFGGTLIEKSHLYKPYNDFFCLNLNSKFWHKIELNGDIPRPMYLQKSGLFFDKNCAKIGVILKAAGYMFGGYSIETNVFEIELAQEKIDCDIFHMKRSLSSCSSFYDLIIYTIDTI